MAVSCTACDSPQAQATIPICMLICMPFPFLPLLSLSLEHSESMPPSEVLSKAPEVSADLNQLLNTGAKAGVSLLTWYTESTGQGLCLQSRDAALGSEGLRSWARQTKFSRQTWWEAKMRKKPESEQLVPSTPRILGA